MSAQENILRVRCTYVRTYVVCTYSTFLQRFDRRFDGLKARVVKMCSNGRSGLILFFEPTAPI